jgi:hypothetical protein
MIDVKAAFYMTRRLHFKNLQDIISGNKIRFGTAQQSLQNFIIVFVVF